LIQWKDHTLFFDLHQRATASQSVSIAVPDERTMCRLPKLREFISTSLAMRSVRPSPKGKLKNLLRLLAATKSRSPGFLDPEFAPAGRANRAIDQGAGARRLKKRAIAALLIPFRRRLISNPRLRHLSGSLSGRKQRRSGTGHTGDTPK
jgi:hypothetical protein